MSKTFEKLQPYLDKSMALQTARNLFEWDDQTTAPFEAAEYTAKVVGILSDEYMKSLVNEDVKKLLKKLQEEKEQQELTEKERAIIRELSKTYEELESIPPDEYREFNELASVSNRKWAKAKKDNSYEDFAPYLKKIIELKKKFACYRAKKGQLPYEVLLSDFDECFMIPELDQFFEKVKQEIIPLLKEVAKKADTIDKSYNYLHYDIQKQKEFCRFLSGYIGFDFNRGVIAESAHPFTLQLHNHDVRITDRYMEDNLESAMFSIIHESGHALYEMNIDDSITQTLVGGGASMGMHESQSRFYENIIARSQEFWEPIYNRLQSTYPENLCNITLKHFIKGINKAAPSLIRTEADELSYPIHIIIRYEIEKMIFQDEVSVEELPKVWNQKYQEYMGISPTTDSEGILQDTHWSWGEFGYFPSYAIGSAVASQLYACMKEKMPLTQYLKEGNLTPIREFLRDNIHKYGAIKNTKQLLKDVCGEDFNADYYVNYLKDKYRKLYDLSI
ncbi:carboxypeptidase M32 [Lachnospiraceae bacterium MD1]|uniref:Metal-dependent carboxypeptidase n=1 Tax=Variimorphobacter saccharofermentans TaxID=2755051 RepID=A0A839K1G2_9FIRM|nr:carboxypeptidase M32 [Variimorphobacter saccharofermentans]MBB2182551.1 carboxypeptidase M32 [Variimorphobacter saccharofermentans]